MAKTSTNITRAHIRQMPGTTGTVLLTYTDEYTGERATREFNVQRSGGYVRENGQHVCERLACRGKALHVSDAAELLPLIRSEWRRSQAAERSARKF